MSPGLSEGGGSKRPALFSLIVDQRVAAPFSKEAVLLIRHHHAGSVYVIECPPGSRVRRSEAAGEGVVYVPWKRGEVPIFEVPGELMVRLAEKGRYGLRLLGIEVLPVS